MAERVKKLRGEYNLLSDNQLRAIAEKEKQLADQQKQREDEPRGVLLLSLVST